MSERRDVFRCKKSFWIFLVALGAIMGIFCVFFMICILSVRDVPAGARALFPLGILFCLGVSISMVIGGLKRRKYVVTVDDEGVQVYGRAKCPWSAITDLSLDGSPKLVIRYTEPSTLKRRKITIRPCIYGFQTAAARIIDLVPDEANLRVPRQFIDAAAEKAREISEKS